MYGDEARLHEFDDGDFPIPDKLRSCDRHIASEALQPVETATTVRIRNGRLALTDGPFADHGEQLLGFCIVDARDVREAIEIVSKLPVAEMGCIEVRRLRSRSQLA
jgi:hypothetical protein